MEPVQKTTKSAQSNLPVIFTETMPFSELENTVAKMDTDQVDMESKRIAVLQQLHKLKSRSAWLIGELLKQQELILQNRYQNWLKLKEAGQLETDAKYTQAIRIYSWVKIHQKELKFGERQARRYIQIRDFTDREVADRLGVKKLDIISKAPKDFQEELKLKCADDNWSAEKTDREVKKLKEKLHFEKVFEKEIKPNLPKVNIRLDKNNPNKIIIETSSKERDILNDLLQSKYLFKIKQDLYYALTAH